MDLLIGFFLFDIVLYLLLRLLPKPRGAPEHAAHHPSDPAEWHRIRPNPNPLPTAPSAWFVHHGIFIRPLVWPRTPLRLPDPQPRW